MRCCTAERCTALQKALLPATHLKRKNCARKSRLTTVYARPCPLPAMRMQPSTCSSSSSGRRQSNTPLQHAVTLATPSPAGCRIKCHARTEYRRCPHKAELELRAGRQADRRQAPPHNERGRSTHMQQWVAALEKDLDSHAKQGQLIKIHACSRQQGRVRGGEERQWECRGGVARQGGGGAGSWGAT
jgi:hypothetical protein